MKLTARDQDQQNALAHAYHGRERFTLTGAGLQAEFVAEVLNRVPCVFGSGRYETNLELIQVTEATTRAAWNGEGLPPVGTLCEWKEKTGFSWVKATVLFITDSSVVMQRGDGFEWQMMTARTVFRPIRTPEQIAEEARQNELNRMVATVSMLDKGWARKVCAGLYDAGYRKQDNAEGGEDDYQDL